MDKNNNHKNKNYKEKLKLLLYGGTAATIIYSGILIYNQNPLEKIINKTTEISLNYSLNNIENNNYQATPYERIRFFEIVKKDIEDEPSLLDNLGERAHSYMIFEHEKIKMIAERERLKKRKENLNYQSNVNPELLKEFNKAYDENNTLSSIFDRFSVNYNKTIMDINDYIEEKIPIDNLEDNSFIKFQKKIYNTTQKLITGKDISNPFHADRYKRIINTKYNLSNSMKRLENEIPKAIKHGEKEFVEELMSKYIELSIRHKEVKDFIDSNKHLYEDYISKEIDSIESKIKERTR
jgi:hypothetical protein